MTIDSTHPDLTRLLNLLSQMNGAVVAFSGGVDSSFLLKTATMAIKGKVVAVTAASPSFPAEELEFANTLAQRLNVEHRIIQPDEMMDERFASNPPNRCYYCKQALFEKIRKIAREEGIATALDGSTLDDLKDYRPGRQATLEAGVRSPLIEASLSKDDVRRLSKALNLPTWNKPASPCLASRFPYGRRIDQGSLRRVEKAERFLKTLGLFDCRVRDYGELACIEVAPHDLRTMLDNRLEIVSFFKTCGYARATLDLMGFRSGSLNEGIVDNQ